MNLLKLWKREIITMEDADLHGSSLTLTGITAPNSLKLFHAEAGSRLCSLEEGDLRTTTPPPSLQHLFVSSRELAVRRLLEYMVAGRPFIQTQFEPETLY